MKESSLNKGGNLPPGIIEERNYKKEINELMKKINNSSDTLDQLIYLQQLKNSIENYIENLKPENIPNNDTLIEKMYLSLTILFTAYSLILKFDIYLNVEEKDNIFLKVIEYLKFFE